MVKREFSERMSHKMIFFLNMVNNYIFDTLMNLFTKKFGKSYRKFVAGFIITSFVMILGHLFIFYQYKKDNLLEIMGVERAFTLE